MERNREPVRLIFFLRTMPQASSQFFFRDLKEKTWYFLYARSNYACVYEKHGGALGVPTRMPGDFVRGSTNSDATYGS